ncbi:trypsin delta-like isoform X2 [Zophobas morio]|uniref:trypsin delta-like isoform X2 n=1 Tax=Zophobas morio TaxID=2755281 RepID=UPI003082D10A
MTHFAILLCSLILLVNSVHVTEKYKPTTFHETDGRIINGENATLGQFPWQTGIYLAYNDTYYWFCGGSIISEEWILTAAHCLDGAETAYAYMATVDLFWVAAVTVSSEFILHEKYNASTLANDIGLIKLDGKIRFDDDVAPIALSSEPLEAGDVVTVSGFGITSDADEEILSQFLNYITVTTITNSECAAVYGDAVLESMSNIISWIFTRNKRCSVE